MSKAYSVEAFWVDSEALRARGSARMNPVTLMGRTMRAVRDELAAYAVRHPDRQVSLYDGTMCLEVWNED